MLLCLKTIYINFINKKQFSRPNSKAKVLNEENNRVLVQIRQKDSSTTGCEFHKELGDQNPLRIILISEYIDMWSP